MTKFFALLILTLSLARPVLSIPQSAPGPAFHKLQALAGDWVGKDDQGNKAETNFKVVAGNTAVMETLTAAGMEEMLTLYTVDGDGIALVHYCPTNNQPRMRSIPGEEDPKEIIFSFQSATNLPNSAIGHQHKLVVQFQDKDHLIERWTWRKEGKDFETTYTFVRRGK
jgi:hypothetical protein